MTLDELAYISGTAAAVIGVWFGLNWLLTKGLIFVMVNLFNLDWSDKFWPVFVLVSIVQLFSTSVSKMAKGN